MRSAGFAVVIGHNVERDAREEMFRASRTFFLDRSPSDKQRFNFGAYGAPTGGFTAQGVEAVARTFDSADSPADLVESYVLTLASFRNSAEHAPELIAAGRKYVDQVSALMHKLHHLSARALGVADDFFDRFYDENASLALRLAHYPAINPSDVAPGQQRYGSHVDYEGFTILAVEEPGDTGLEVWLNGAWNKVSCPADGLIVNVGELITYWSGGRWKATLHRVVNSHPERPRFSLPFFSGPNLKAEVVPIGSPPGTRGILAGEHLQRQLDRSNTKPAKL